jgi:hypothetical protein
MSDLLEAALDYGRRGWPVLPIEPRGKRPLGRLVPHGLHDASTDEATIERWWKAEPEANVAIATGHGCDVLDLDGRDGIDALLAAQPSTMPEDQASGPCATSRLGHWHVYFAPLGLGNRAGLLPHVDWRGRGGFVVAPPSRHESGSVYEWSVDFGLDTPLEPPPGWLLRLLKPEPKVPIAPPRARTVEPSRYGVAALEREAGRVALAPEGQRNHTLNAAAFNLGQLVAGGALDVDDVVSALSTAASRAGLPDREAERTIASGLAAGASYARGVPA